MIAANIQAQEAVRPAALQAEPYRLMTPAQKLRTSFFCAA